jgi:hypothetical protein
VKRLEPLLDFEQHKVRIESALREIHTLSNTLDDKSALLHESIEHQVDDLIDTVKRFSEYHLDHSLSAEVKEMLFKRVIRPDQQQVWRGKKVRECDALLDKLMRDIKDVHAASAGRDGGGRSGHKRNRGVNALIKELDKLRRFPVIRLKSIIKTEHDAIKTSLHQSFATSKRLVSRKEATDETVRSMSENLVNLTAVRDRLAALLVRQ